jgi:hypothetical protein
MKYIVLVLTYLALVSCINEKAETSIPNLTHSETEIINNNIEVQGKSVALPQKKISKETIFDGFPDNPNFFIENSIEVNIVQKKQESSSFPNYFGSAPVYVTGENFEIIYTTDNGYNVNLIVLKGKSIFFYWNVFFDATWDDVKEAWGEPKESGRCYYDGSGWYFIDFISVDNITGKIKEIRLGISL